MNSWLHNVPVLAEGKGKARVRSQAGEVIAEAEVSAEMMPGVVSLPRGFGHTRPGSRLGIAASDQPGVNANQLTDEIPLDVPSGTYIANGIPVEIEAG